MCFLNKLRSVAAVALTACPWPATSARTIRESKPVEADRQVAVNITALCCGWQWLGMDPAHESEDLHDVHDVVPTPDLRGGQLCIGIRSEPGPHELSS
jgi:hypothetical protein